MKWKLIKLVIAFLMLLQPVFPMMVEATNNQGIQMSEQVSSTSQSTVLTNALFNSFLNHLDDDETAEIDVTEPVHLSIEDLYKQLQEHDRIYDDYGGFYELVPISEFISVEDLERVIDELNDENYSIITDFALFNVEGELLPMPRSHVVRHQRFLGTQANSMYFFRHVPGFNADGNLPPTTTGNGWRMQTWQINIGGTWLRAFCTQPGIPSAEPGHDDLPGWNPSDSAGLSAIQRETIGRILQHGYRNLHRPPTSNSANWSFPSGEGADTLLDDAILVTQIMIQEVSAGQWTWQNITSGTRSPIITNGVYGDPWRRLIANSATSTGMVGGPTWNVTQGIGGTSFDPRPAVGSTQRMDMYDAIRHDIYFFNRRNNRPTGTSASSTTANRPVHSLTWNATHQMYRVTIDDRISSGGTGTLHRFFGNRYSGSLGIGGGYRFCRGQMVAGVCNPEGTPTGATRNRVYIYTRDSSAPPTNSADGFMRWNPTGSRDRAVGFFVNPNYQNKVIGALQNVFDAHFRVQISPRSRPPVEVIKYSNATNGRLAGAQIELCRGSTTNVAGQTAIDTVDTAWCWVVTTNAQGIANFPANGSLVNSNGNPFEGMLLGRRYRVREIAAPPGYILPPMVERTNWVEAPAGGATSTRTATFRNDPATSYARVRKTSNVTGNVIPGTVFHVRYRNIANTAWETIRVGTTGNDGTFTFVNIPVGRSAYEIREYSVPGNYIVDSRWQSFGPVRAGETVEIDFRNDRTGVRLSATKMGTGNAILGANERPLAGTIFRFYYEAVMNSNNWSYFETVVTNNAGVATTATHDLLPATGSRRFRAVETNVPAPWVVGTPNYRIVTLSQQNATQQLVTGAMTFTNVPALGRIDVLKTGTAPNGAIIPGGNLGDTQFRLYHENAANSNTWTHLVTQTTGSNGQTRFDNIALGSAPIRFRVCESDVPAPWYIGGEPCQIVTLSRQSPTQSLHAVTMTFTNRQAVGRIDVTKTGTAPSGALVTGGNLSGTQFRLYRENTANSNTWTHLVTQTTGSNGQTRFDNIALGSAPIRFRVCESDVVAPWVIPANSCQIVTLSRANNTQSLVTQTLRFENEQALGRVEVTKQGTANPDSIVNAGLVSGTIFELFREDVPMSGNWRSLGTSTTNANGLAVFDRIVLHSDARRFKVVEIYVPEPFYISPRDSQIFTLSRLSPNHALTTAELLFTNDQAVGEITLTKTCEVTGMLIPGAIFEIYGNGIRFQSVTNEYGEIVFANLPLGNGTLTYIITEIYVPAPWLLDPTPIIVEISRDDLRVNVSRRTAYQENDIARGRVRINKLGNHIVGFEDYIDWGYFTPEVDEDGEVHHPEQPEFEDEYNYNDQHGQYESKVEEPSDEGILTRAWNWLTGIFTSDETDDEVTTTIVDENTNPPHLTGGIEPTAQAGIRWIFEYLAVENVRFNIYARDPIVLPDGTIYHETGNFVGYYYTNEDGFIESSSLHLGNYFIREVFAPNGWYIRDIEIDFSLVYVNQYTEIVFDDLEVKNEWISVEINLAKVGEIFGGHLDFTHTFTYLEGVRFGLFAGQDFEFINGQVMDKGTLIEDGFTDEYGRLQFSRELPLGLFYIQEMDVADHYVTDDTKHFFEHIGDVQDAPLLEVKVDSLARVYNEFVRGSFEIIKVSRDFPIIPEVDGVTPEVDEDGQVTLPDNEIEYDEPEEYNNEVDIDYDAVERNSYEDDIDYEDSDEETEDNENSEDSEDDTDFEDIDLDDLETPTPEVDIAGPFLAGVYFELWNLDLDEYVGNFITDDDGHIFIDGLIFGSYRLTEIKTDPRHQLNQDPIYFTIDREHQVHSWLIFNYKTNTNILKIDDLGQPLEGAYFQVIEVATNQVVAEWVSTDEPHVILGLNHGEHILRETEAPYGFLLMEDIYFTVTDSLETIYLVAENELDSSVSIATQAHTGDGTTQYFTYGDIIEMFDDINITHTHIREGTPRAFRVYLFAVIPNGNPANESDRTLIWYSDYREYTVENVLMTFKEATNVDTSNFSFGTTFFFAETAYREILDDDDNRTGWEEDYRHNWCGSDQRQMLLPRPMPERPRLPQTGSSSRIMLYVALGTMVTVTACVVIKAHKSKANRININRKNL